MLCFTCTVISSVDLAHYKVSCAKDWVSVDCGTRNNTGKYHETGKDPDQTPRAEASDLGLHCCLCPIYGTIGIKMNT